MDVQDDGPGIPREQAAKIFRPFFTTRAADRGTGLGLTLCREILRDHEGDIELVRGKGAGACFRVRLPAAVADERRSRNKRQTADRAARIRGRRIVIVEDEAPVRELVTRTFTGNDNHLVAFERGEDALPYLLSEAVDLVISDVLRPGLDGISLYERIRGARPELARRFLFLTGDTESARTQSFFRRTGAASLKKPVSLVQLARAAEGLLHPPVSQGLLFQ